MNEIIGYKFLTDAMKSQNGNEQWEKDVWKEWDGKLEICASGYHACRTPLQSLQYVYGNRWFIVEAGGKILEEPEDKFVCSRMRIIHELPVKEIMLRFAIACAKNSLFRFEQQHPQDDRPRKAIEIAEAVLLGTITGKEAESAARSATESAARLAARSAAWSAAWSAESAARLAESAARLAESAARLAESAAWSAESAARSAAWSAWSAESAAWSAGSAESAAWSAARSAARSAAWSAARSAARSAWSAWSAARSAAESAARLAEKKWQEKKLQRIIFEEVGI